MIDKKKVGHQLKELRISRGWLQDYVAQCVGLSRSAISNIESGKRALTLDTLQRFCEAFSIDISYFGIETVNLDDVKDITARVEAIFKSNDIPESRKDAIYREIMRIYLDNR